jgi:hypothetical protein
MDGSEPGSAIAAGWYEDPSGRYRARWWDGREWTDEVAAADGNQLSDPREEVRGSQAAPTGTVVAAVETVPIRIVPSTGLPAWDSPDPTVASTHTLDPGLDVHVLEHRGGWALVQCSNGWTCWVDGSALLDPSPPVTTERVAAPPARESAAQQATLVAPLALLAGALVTVSAFLPWFSFQGVDLNGFKIPLHFLVSADSAPSTDAKLDSVGGLLLLAGLVLAGLAFTRLPLARRTAASVVGLVCVGYIFQMSRSLNDSAGAPSVTSVLAFGAYLALFAAALGYADIKRWPARTVESRLR